MRSLSRLVQERLDKRASEMDAFVQGNRQGASLDSSDMNGEAQPNLDEEPVEGELAGPLGANRINTLIPEKDLKGPTSAVAGLKEQIKAKLG